MRVVQVRLRSLMLGILALAAVFAVVRSITWRTLACRERILSLRGLELKHRAAAAAAQDKFFPLLPASGSYMDPPRWPPPGMRDREIAVIEAFGKQYSVERARALQAASLREKYERAMWRVWEPMPKDPNAAGKH